jgi:hypothetical protein
MFWTKVVEKIKTHILYLITFFFKSCRLWDNVEKYGGSRGATTDVTIWCIRDACCISKATCTHALAHVRTHTHKCVIFVAFHGNNALRTYLIVTLYVPFLHMGWNCIYVILQKEHQIYCIISRVFSYCHRCPITTRYVKLSLTAHVGRLHL